MIYLIIIRSKLFYRFYSIFSVNHICLAQSDISVTIHDTSRITNQTLDTSESGYYRFYTYLNNGSDTHPFGQPASEEICVNISEVLNSLGNTVGVYEAGFTYRTSDLRIVGYRIAIFSCMMSFPSGFRVPGMVFGS